MTIDTKRLETDAAYWDEVFSPCTKRIAIEKDKNGYIAQIVTQHPLSGNSFEMIKPNNSINFLDRPTTPAAPEWGGEGLPPVGCECEATPPIRYSGSRLRVLCHDEGAAICRVLEGDKMGSLVELCANEIRPIPTKAQRDRDELFKIIGNCANYSDIPDAILSRYNLEPKP